MTIGGPPMPEVDPMKVFKCPYCGLDTTGSEEHVIPHALGGSLKSEWVCCNGCNNQLGKIVDAPFIKMFAPLCAKMKPLNGMHEFVGAYAVNLLDPGDRATVFPGMVKRGKIVCPELSKRLKCPPSALNLSERDIYSIPLAWDTQVFKNGLAKIAFGFALHSGINCEQLMPFVDIDRADDGKIKGANFSFPVVPFSPLNQFDRFVELQTTCKLHHHLLLFCQGKCLWCYVDLFNTFQFYVLLSSSFSDEIPLQEHFQYAESLDRDIPTFRHGRSPKDIQIDAMTYGVEPTLDEDELDKRIANAIKTKSVTTLVDGTLKDALEQYSAHLRRAMATPVAPMSCSKISLDVVAGFRDVQYYFDEDDRLRHDRYRQTFYGEEEVIKSYPVEDAIAYGTHQKDVCEYTQRKFARLWNYLISQKR